MRRTPSLVASLAGLFAGLVLASPAQADPSIAGGLLAGRTTAGEAAQAWAAQGLDADQALEQLRAARPVVPAEAPARIDLEDGHGRESFALISMPDAPRADGRYGVMLVLHGLGGRAGHFTGLARKVAPPGFIVVAPNAQKLPRELEGEDVPGLGIASLALQHWWSYRPDGFAFKALDAVRARFPVDPDRVILFGYSMGGYGVWNIGLRYPHRFAAIVPLAGGISRLENLVRRDARSHTLVANGVHVPSFVVHGTADGTVPYRFSATATRELREAGADVTFHTVEGGTHDPNTLFGSGEITADLRRWLANKVRDPNPATVHHTALSGYHGRSYWLQLEPARRSATASATVQPGNRIVVQTEGASRLSLFLDPDLVDVRQPVTVVVDDRVLFHGVVPADLQTLAASFAATHDPELSYARRIDLDLVRPVVPAF